LFQAVFSASIELFAIPHAWFDDSHGDTGKHKTHRECFDHLDYAPLVVEFVLRRDPDLGEVAAAVVLRGWRLHRRLCE
jgi:hypothetical protein